MPDKSFFAQTRTDSNPAARWRRFLQNGRRHAIAVNDFLTTADGISVETVLCTTQNVSEKERSEEFYMVEVSTIIRGIDVLESRGEIPSRVEGLCYDSRQVEPGTLFVALRGTRTDGHQYLCQAFATGASVAVVEEIPAPVPGPCIRVRDTLVALPVLAASFYSHPAENLILAAVTGSNGKTSTTYLVESMWAAARHPCAVIGTIQYRWKDHVLKAPNTTPLSSDLQKLFAQIRDDAIERVILEVSSHALRLHRVDGLQFRAATFTNLSPEH
ncbi:MAG: Mur ligase family protein, partial [bacterium]